MLTNRILAPPSTNKRVVSTNTTVGRSVAVIAMVIAVIAARPFLGGFESAFQTVQEYTGFVAPGVVAVFLLGIFFQRTNAVGAFAALILSILASLVFKFEFPEFSFVNRIWLVFLICMVGALVASRLTAAPREAQLVRMGNIDLSTTRGFNIASVNIAIMLVGIYVVFW